MKHQNRFLKSDKVRKHMTLLSDANVPVHFKEARGQLYRSQTVSPTPFQTDLRINNHKGYKFPPSLTLVSIQNSNRMTSRLTAIASFLSVFFQFLQYSRQHPSFLAHTAALMTKTNLTYPAFPSSFVDFI